MATPSTFFGSPALGMTETGVGACWHRYRTGSRKCSGPTEQLTPITSARIPCRIASTAPTSVPSSIRPVTSSATCTCSGTGRPSSRKAARAPSMAARVSRMSCCVSMMIRSAPPSTSAAACSQNASESPANEMPESAGSSLDGSIPLGPIEPATNRGRDGVEYASAALRAIWAAHRLISRVWSATPHSAIRIRDAWKLFVSTTSAPASRYARWMPSMASGRVSDRWSLLPS